MEKNISELELLTGKSIYFNKIFIDGILPVSFT